MSKDSQNSIAVSSVGSKRLVKSFEDLKAEFWRISWTSTEHLKASTKVAIFSILLCAMLIYSADLLIQLTLYSVSWIMRWVFG